jgi:hypothetical protein
MPGAFCHGIVKNQQRSAAEVWQIKARGNFELPNFPQSRDRSSGEKLAVPNFAHSRDKLSGEKFSRSAPGTQASLAPTRLRRVDAAAGGMPGAFCHGIVKNQQRSAAEVWQIKEREKLALLDL